MKEDLLNFVSGLGTTTQISIMVINTAEDDKLEAGTFFVDKPACFHFKGKRLTLEVDTTMLGPGYHVTELGILEAIERETRLRWDRSTMHDDTGYYEHRDFKRLQRFMLDWLLEYSSSLLNTPDLELPVRTNLTMPYAMLPQGNEYFACHLLGYIHRDFFVYIHEFKDPELFCQAFFLWWNEDLSAKFYLKCALSIIWCQLNWLPPALDEEFIYIDHALKQLEAAWELDNTLPLPVPEWIELAKLSRDQELVDELIRRFPTEINQPASKGYRRHDILHTIGENRWKIKLPGKMHHITGDDGALLFWDDRQRSIRITVIHGCAENGSPLPGMTLLQKNMGDLKAEWHILPEATSVPAFMLHGDSADKDKSSCDTTLFAATDGIMVIVNVSYPEEEQKAWAVSLCDSLSTI
jgi:hypothetical protein